MLSAFTLGWAVIFADRSCLYPLLPAIAASLSLNSTETGILTSTYFFFYVLMQIPAGVIGDRVGLKKVLLVMYAVAALGILGLGLTGKSYLSLLLFIALHGLGAGSYYPAAYGTLLQVVPAQRRGLNSAIIGTGMSMGLLFGLALSGPVYSRLGDFQAPFLLLSLPTLLMLLFFYRTVPDVKCPTPPTWRDYKAILTDKELWLINAATFTALYGFWVAMTWGPTYLKIERGFSLGQAGLYTGLVALTSVPAGLFWGKLSDRLGRKTVACVVLPAAGASLYLISQAMTPLTIIGAFLLFGVFCNSSFTPVMAAWTGDLTGKRYPGLMGAAIGVFNCVIMTAAILAPVVSGYLRDVTGSLVPAIVAGSIMMFGGTFLLLLLPNDKQANLTYTRSEG